MGNKFLKNTPPPLANYIVMSQPKHSDSLFIGDGWGRLQQTSTRQRKVIKHYGKMMESLICSLKTSPDKKHLYIYDYFGD